uniref:Multiple epidermal growth factor-like domains 10 n=1 Tax=Magallana gigas TaxID=29159 RepID=A0A8W8MSG1_MAGGI
MHTEGCKERWYGVNCSQLCIGHCRDNTTCNHVTGQCDKGCDAGWTGLKCDRECVDGTYGYACVKNCSGHCQNESSCNKQTGYCDRGCNPGYTDNDCRLGVLQKFSKFLTANFKYAGLNVSNLMEKTANIPVVSIVSTRHVIDLQENAYLGVKLVFMEKSVIKHVNGEINIGNWLHPG